MNIRAASTSSTQATQGTQSAQGSQANAANGESSRTELGKDAFLKLLLTELRYQDAFKPVDDKEMIAQLAQFSTMEQMQNLSTAMEGLARMQHATQAAALIGKTVAATVDDEVITGTVSGVRFKDGVAYLVVDEREILVTDVTEIG